MDGRWRDVYFRYVIEDNRVTCHKMKLLNLFWSQQIKGQYILLGHCKLSTLCRQSSKTSFSTGTCGSFSMRKHMLKVINSFKMVVRTDHHEAASPEKLPHLPVMLNEVLRLLNPSANETFLDMTFGAGGHSSKVLNISPDSRVIALDRDPLAYSYALELQQKHSSARVIPLLGRFTDVARLLLERDIQPGSIDGVIMDLGTSSMQFDHAHRGFSLSRDGPLDMRMDGGRLPDQPTASDVVNYMSEVDLFHIIKKYGEESMARKIANMIVESRYAYGRIKTTKQLADIISSVFEIEYRKDKLNRHAHVATKTFQALRIFVNNELNELDNGMEIVHKFLKPGGICVVLSFHSLEDRIVKRHFHGIAMEKDPNMSVWQHQRNSILIHTMEDIDKAIVKHWQPYSKKVVTASESNCVQNPRSRSVKLRAAYKLDIT